ncbi:hypothetical protein TH606_07720 [Thermodesulfatator autotrophicus]|uniref:Uncharacterized protein n=2 Tax=Thermodesulfatator autotrophicus TaxID=1795632 RepID=A0A177E785_9BACT|nr:hypothetical protein TH606_07720 [Thermodesulfatator autotrophicus]
MREKVSPPKPEDKKKRFIVVKKRPFFTTTTRIVCPYCGNDEDFWEYAEGVTIKTHYIQNEDGSFSPISDDTQIFGEIRFICGKCNSDLTKYHKQFLEMLF